MTSPAPASPSAPRPWLAGLALVAAVFAAYVLSLRGQFLWDDDLHVTANPTIIGPLGLKEIWTSARANYFPLVLTNFWLQHAAWGVEPLGYRLVTLAFHAGAALLLWRVLLRLAVPGAWLGAALWALHPVQVESVAWICELKNTQSAVFFLASVACWLRWIEPARPGASRGRDYGLALLCAVAAILSKPSTVMLPVALGVCSVWRRGGVDVRDALRLAPFFALSALAAGWTIWEQKYHSGAIGPEWSQGLPERIAIAGHAIWFYLGKLAWPEPLIFIYPRWEFDPSHPWIYLPAAGAVAGLLWLWRRRAGGAGASWVAAAYFVALLFPVLGFFNVYFFRYSFVGDHFQYLASIGPLALAGALLSRVAARIPGRIALGLGLVALGLLTVRQTRGYRSSEALWRETVARNPVAVMAWLNLGDLLAQAGRIDESMQTYRTALTLKPSDPDGWNDLGNLLVMAGRPQEAVPHFEKALALRPDYADVHSNFGHALRKLGRTDEAIARYRRALELKPGHTGALNNLGAELAEQGKTVEALALFERAWQEAPSDAATLDNLAGALRGVGRLEDALARHRDALKLKPEFASARANYARTLLKAGRNDAALAEYERALQQQPDQAAIRGQYALALAQSGRPAEAFAELERAVALAPNSADAHLNLGSALAQSGRTPEAIGHFETALRLSPGLAAAEANLGTALVAEGRWAKAVPHLQAAVDRQPDAVAYRMQLAVALVNDGQLPAAVPHFEAALRLTPNSPELHDQFGQVLGALGRRRESFEHLEEAARLRRSGGR